MLRILLAIEPVRSTQQQIFPTRKSPLPSLPLTAIDTPAPTKGITFPAWSWSRRDCGIFGSLVIDYPLCQEELSCVGD